MDIQNEIRYFIIEHLLFGDDMQLDGDTPLHESGIIDSTGFLEILTFIEEKYSIEVADDEVIPDNFKTLNKISSFVEYKIQNKDITYTQRGVA